MGENNPCNSDDTDEERPRRRLKGNGLDIKPFEINSCRRLLIRSKEDPNLCEPLFDGGYSIFLKRLMLESEPSNSPIEGGGDSDEEDDLDPQYMMFLENYKRDGRSYKLEIATKNGMMSVIYEREDDSDDDCGLQCPVKLKNVVKRKGVEYHEDPIMGHDRGRVRDGMMKETLLKLETPKFMGNNPSENRIGTRRSPRICNNLMDSKNNLKSNLERETTQKIDRDVKPRLAKDLKNLPIRMDMETRRSLRIGGPKHVDLENKRGREKGKSMEEKDFERETAQKIDRDVKPRVAKDLKNLPIRMEVETRRSLRIGGPKHVDMENKRGREKGKSMEEKYFKSKHANHPQAKAYENCGKKSREKGDGLFGCDFHHKLNDDDVDECYRTYLKSVTVEDDYILYAVKGQKPVKHEQFDVDCSSDSEVLVTTDASEFNEGGCNPFQTSKLFVKPDNQLQCIGSCEGDNKSLFRKKLMARIGEPYDDKEYKIFWNEINKERPKTVHRDLRGSGATKQFLSSELSPSYLATYAPFKKKIDAVGLDRCKRLKFLRAFFFWLQNVVHDDTFMPWLDKSCLEMMRK